MLKRRTAVECLAVPGMQTTLQTASQTASQMASQMASQTAGGETLQTLMQQGADDVELKVGGEAGGEA